MEIKGLCVSQTECISVTSTSCAAVLFVYNFQPGRVIMSSSLFGDIYSCVCGSLSQNSENKSETATNQMLKYISAAAHHTVVLRWFRKHCFTSLLCIHICTFFLSPPCFQTTTNNLFHTLCSTAASQFSRQNWLLKFRSCFILQRISELISPLVWFVMLPELHKTSHCKQETDRLAYFSSRRRLYQYSSNTRVDETPPRLSSTVTLIFFCCL